MSNKQITPPVNAKNYPSYLWQYISDKTGTIYQSLTGRLSTGGPWGVRVWRIAPGEKPELIYFLQDGNGKLSVDPVTKQLMMLTTDKNWNPGITIIEGYVHPVDCPDSTVININESQVASLKQSIATTQNMANNANTTANNAIAKSDDMQKQINAMQKRIDSLQNQVNSLLTPQQVADLVWQKLKDMNYLYRLAFLAWPTNNPDPDIKAYVDDLVTLIKKAK